METVFQLGGLYHEITFPPAVSLIASPTVYMYIKYQVLQKTESEKILLNLLNLTEL
jgi:hypothetical protein